MNENFKSKLTKVLTFFFIASIFVGISYVFVYELSILPNGFDIDEAKNDHVTIKSFNIFGFEKSTIAKSFTENEIWKKDEIENAVKREKEFFWFFYSAVSISIFLLIYNVRKGLKVWKAVLKSNIIFAVLLPIVPIIHSMNRIVDLIS